MVKIMAKHHFRNKTVELVVSEKTITSAENGYAWAIRRIFKIYLKVCGYKESNLKPGSMSFWQVTETPKSTFAHRTDNLSACEKENCSFCEAGKYEECPNNRHK